MVLVASSASAQTKVDTKSDSTSTPDAYGWQIAISDISTVCLIPLFVHFKASTELYAIPLGLYLISGPTVHALHQRGGPAILSFFLRLTVPPSLGFVLGGIAAASDREGYAGLALAILGSMLGAVAAVLLDVFALSPPPRSSTAPAPSTTPASPFVQVDRESTRLAPTAF